MTTASKVQAARCRSCGARIFFATMERTGKNAPFELDANGEWIITAGGIASFQGKTPEFFPQVAARYTSHFARCAQAKSRRKK